MEYCSDRKRKMKHHSDGQSDMSGSLNMSAGTGDHVKEKKHLSSSSEDVLQVQGVDNSSSRIAVLISPSFSLPFWWALFYTFYIYIYIYFVVISAYFSCCSLGSCNPKSICWMTKNENWRLVSFFLSNRSMKNLYLFC